MRANATPYRALSIRKLSPEHQLAIRKLVAARGSIVGIAERMHVGENTVRDAMGGATFRKTTADRLERLIDELVAQGERAA